MTAPGNSIVQIAIALMFAIASAYAGGRIQQWYKQGLDRDEAFRTGYNQASHAMLQLAMTKQPAPPAVPARQTPASHVVHVTRKHATPIEPTRQDIHRTADTGPRHSRSVGHTRRRITSHPDESSW